MPAYEKAGYSLGGRSPIEGGSKDIKNKMDDFYQYAYTSNGAAWQQAYIDKRFKVGDQSLNNLLYGDNNFYRSRKFFFNLIRKHINMICGFQRRNRKSTTVLPRNDDDRLAEQYSKALKWSETRDGFQEYFSQAFEGAADVGLSFLHLYPDYTYDPYSGDLFTDCVSFTNILVDPYFRKQDLSDCNAIWRRRWVTKEMAKTLLPSASKDIEKLSPTGAKDGRFPLQAELLNMQASNLMAYDEFHYRDTRRAKMILDPFSGEATEWEETRNTPTQNDEIKRTLALQPWLKVKEMSIPTVRLAIVVSNKVLYEGENLLGVDQYPFVPMLWYHEPDIQSYSWRFTGMTRNLRDAQFLYNRRKVIELQIMESQINSGYIYPVDAVVDPKAFRQTEQGTMIPLKAGHLPSEIQIIQAPQIPASMIEISKSLAEDITKISGVTEELLGSSVDDKSGILNMLRQSAGITTLQTVLDKADYTQRLYGQLRLQAIRRNFTEGKLASILGEKPDPLFTSSLSLKYNIQVEEGNYTATQRQTELQQKLHFREMGIPISDRSILKSAYLSDKDELEEEMNQQQQQQQQQQEAQAAQQQQKDNAEMMLKFAEARAKMASAEKSATESMETAAKVQDLQANAEHERTKSELDLVEMLIKLEDLDLGNLKKSLELVEVIKNSQQAQGQGQVL